MKPNIVLVQAESLDGRALACMGESGAYTPNIDRLAARGAVFDSAYCNSPQCCPSRASMWSGRYVWQVGAWNNYRGLPRNERTFVDDLTESGYECGVLGRTDHRSGSHSEMARMSAWVRTAPDALYCNSGPRHSLNQRGRRQREGDWNYLDEAKQWLETGRDQNAPFFLHLGLGNTHPGGGYNTSEYWLEKIDPAQVTMPAECEETHPVMRRMLETKGCDRDFDPEFVHTCRRHYLAMVAEVDGIVGDLMETLEACGELENTLVLFTADHGDMRLEHNQYLKNALYEGSARVPLVVAGPGVGCGVREPRAVSLVDLYPTFLDWAGVEPPARLSGHSVADLAAGADSAHPGVAFSEYHSNFQQTGSFMLRSGAWKYIRHVGYAPQLFNLEEDPDEVADRSVIDPETRDRMHGELESILDCAAADAAAKAVDAAEFATWRLNFPGESYLAAVAERVQNWGPAIAHRFAEWVERTQPTRSRPSRTAR